VGVPAAPEGETESAGRLEFRWQRELPPNPIRELVLDDERLRNEICGACSTVDDLAFVVRHRGRRG
jgi:hypothetical protein